MGSDIFSCYLLAALFDVCDFADIAAPLKDRKRLRDLASGGMRYGFAELRVALTANRVQAGSLHSRLLHLVDRPSRFDRMMLPLVADEDDARDTFITCFVKKAVDLTRWEQARFVDNPDFPLACACGLALEEACYGPGGNTGLGKRLDCARGRR